MKNLVIVLDNWAEKHHPLWIDILRMVFGILVITKAIIFIGAAPTIHHKWLLVPLLGIQVLGGTFIMLGLLTRWASLAQLPIIIITVIFSAIDMHGFFLNSEMLLSVILFFLSILFFAEGLSRFPSTGLFATVIKPLRLTNNLKLK